MSPKSLPEQPTPTRHQKKNARAITGRQIVRIELNPMWARDDSDGIVATDPTLYLDDGTTLSFVAEETDFGVYGTALRHHGRSLDRVVVSFTRAEAQALRFAGSNAVEDEEMNANAREAKTLRAAVMKLENAEKA